MSRIWQNFPKIKIKIIQIRKKIQKNPKFLCLEKQKLVPLNNNNK
jgi:hypothetical protein